jgi:hypothetical protein
MGRTQTAGSSAFAALTTVLTLLATAFATLGTAAAVLASSAAILTSSAAAADDAPAYRIATKRGDDRVEVQAGKDQVIVSIHSPFGIGDAVIERIGEKWPDAVVLRLHLGGLESFRASNGKLVLDAAVSSQDRTVRQWKDGAEDAPLDAKSPYWMNLRIVGGDGKPAAAIPLVDGYFDVLLPKALLAENPKSITVRWIDFYRN